MPGARAAVQATRTRQAGLMATEATVRSGSYQRALHVLDAGIEVEAVACPLLAPLIQEGDVFSERVEDAVREYVGPLKRHLRGHGDFGLYPLSSPHTHAPPPARPRVALVNSAEEIAREVVEIIDRKQMGNVREREGTYAFFATSNPEEFRAVGAFLTTPHS